MVHRRDGAAKLPARQTEGSAGYDLTSVRTCSIDAFDRKLVSTGLSVRIPSGCYGRIAPRSSLACRGIDVGAGVIDSDYRGVVHVLLINSTGREVNIEKG